MTDAVVKVLENRAVVTIGGGELVALRAAQAALPYAERAEDALQQIEAIASDAPDAPSILNKLDKGANLSDLTDFVAARANLGVRYVGGRTFYVRPDGSDTNTGLANTANGAFQTIQKAINAAYSIDAKGAVVQIQIADGTYAEGLNIYGRPVGAFDNGDQPLRIIGNPTSPQNVAIRPANQDAIRIGDKATVLFNGLTIGTTGASGNGIFASNEALVWHQNCRLDACAGETIATTTGAKVYAIGPTAVVGASQSFVHATNRSIVGFGGRALTFADGLNFATYLWGINDASVYLDSATIVGKAGGGITVHIGGILNVSSCTGVWTGGQPHKVTTGGRIIAEDKMALKTFYVRNDGNNHNSGFDNTADGAFFSLGGALKRLREMPYDLVGYENDGSGSYDWRIVLPAGTFDEAVELPDTRFARVTIQGASPTTTIAKSYISRARRTVWTIANQQLGGSGVTCLQALEGANLNFSNIAVIGSDYIGICDNNSVMSSLAQPLAISGSLGAAFLTRFGGRINLDGTATTITGNPAIGRFAMAQTNASIFANGMTFTGTATGNRFDVTTNGVIDTNSGGNLNFFPGNSAGATALGGQYV